MHLWPRLEPEAEAILGDERSERRWRPWLAIAALAFLLILPAMLSPIKLHDSFWIDWVWVDQFGDQLRQGVLYPRWLPASHDGLGSPVFYYYPPLAFYPAGLLAALGLTPHAAIVATFGLAFAGSGAAMYLWARGWTNHPLAAALFFMAAPYHLADFYGRGALAETCAIALIPLLALGLKRVAEGKGPALAAIAYAAMIATHLPLALLASLFLVAPYALVLAKGRPRALLAFAPPLAIGIALSAIYLVPALALEPYRDAAVLVVARRAAAGPLAAGRASDGAARRHAADHAQGDRGHRAAGLVHGLALALGLGGLGDRCAAWSSPACSPSSGACR